MDDSTSDKSATWVTLAHLLRPQGRKGEILAELSTDFPERFSDRTGISLRRPNGQVEPVTVEDHWLPVGRNAGRVVLKLQGIASIDDADRLAGSDIVVPPEQRVALEQDHPEEDDRHLAQYVADLLDCVVFDGERSVGTIEDVHFPTSSIGTRLSEAAPLLVVSSPAGTEFLIPFAKAWIESIDIPAKRIAMRLPEGLLDING